MVGWRRVRAWLAVCLGFGSACQACACRAAAAEPRCCPALLANQTKRLLQERSAQRLPPCLPAAARPCAPPLPRSMYTASSERHAVPAAPPASGLELSKRWSVMLRPRRAPRHRQDDGGQAAGPHLGHGLCHPVRRRRRAAGRQRSHAGRAPPPPPLRAPAISLIVCACVPELGDLQLCRRGAPAASTGPCMELPCEVAAARAGRDERWAASPSPLIAAPALCQGPPGRVPSLGCCPPQRARSAF